MSRIKGKEAPAAPGAANLLRLVPPRAVDRDEGLAFSWGQLEAQLTALRPAKAGLIRQVLRMLRRRARRQSSDATLREVLCAAWTLLEPPTAEAGAD